VEVLAFYSGRQTNADVLRAIDQRISAQSGNANPLDLKTFDAIIE
jgi:hypothetical protein